MIGNSENLSRASKVGQDLGSHLWMALATKDSTIADKNFRLFEELLHEALFDTSPGSDFLFWPYGSGLLPGIKEQNDYLSLVWVNMCAVDLGSYTIQGTFDGVQHSQSKPFRLGDLLSNAVRDFEWRQNRDMKNNSMLVDGELAPLSEPPW